LEEAWWRRMLPSPLVLASFLALAPIVKRLGG